MPTIAEVDAHYDQYRMEETLDEPCPQCQGTYQVGDYVCWGVCFWCANTAVVQEIK